MTERIFIVGTGLIGGSIGLALREHADVSGFDVSEENVTSALDAGAIAERASSIGDGASNADLVVIATPVGAITETVREVAGSAGSGTVVTDVGSTKGTIVAEAEALLGPERPFVGGHPMAGTEGEGVTAARADLFTGALWILTPTEHTDSDAYRRVNTLVTKLGARALALEPSEHDRLVAFVSHLPYTLATSLMALAADEGDERVFRAAAGGFRDMTRTAGSNPRVWRDIFSTNKDAIVREVENLVTKLTSVRDAMVEGRWNELDALVDAARSARKRFPPKGERAPADPVTVEVTIPDRTGTLAEITMAMGEGGINIEDLWVDHTASGGVLHLVVDGAAVGTTACELLSRRGFRASIIKDER